MIIANQPKHYARNKGGNLFSQELQHGWSKTVPYAVSDKVKSLLKSTLRIWDWTSHNKESLTFTVYLSGKLQRLHCTPPQCRTEWLKATQRLVWHWLFSDFCIYGFLLDPVAQKIISVSFSGLHGVFSRASSCWNSTVFSIIPLCDVIICKEITSKWFHRCIEMILGAWQSPIKKTHFWLTKNGERNKQVRSIISKENPRKKPEMKHEANWGESRDFFSGPHMKRPTKLEVSPWCQKCGNARTNHSDNINMHIGAISRHINMELSF